MDGTVLSQGTFTVATGVPQNIVQIPSNADFMWVRNFTQSGAAGSTTPAIGFNFYWQRGMAAGSAILQYKTNALLTDNTDTITSGGFTLYDPSGQSASAGAAPVVGPAVAISAVSNATRPIVTTTSTAGLVAGMIVRLSFTATPQYDVGGVDMVVGTVTDSTHFTLLVAVNTTAATSGNALATAPGLIGGAGFYRIVSYPLFYPRRRFITNYGNVGSTAIPGLVATSTAHGFTPGQVVRLSIPSVSGSVELNSTPQNFYQTFTIQSVPSDYLFIITPPSGGVTAFTYPTSALIAAGNQFPFVSPVGEDTANALVNLNAQVPSIGGLQIANTQTGILADATVNTGYLGMILGNGGTALALNAAVSGPAGNTAGDVMYWVAGKSAFGGL